MLGELKHLLRDESGSDLIEWIVVTVILIVAFCALLQAFGPQIENAVDWLGAHVPLPEGFLK